MVRQAGWRRAVVLASTSVLAALLLPASAGATHRGHVIDEVTMHVSYQGSSLPGAPGQLLARLEVDDGSPIADLSVEFWREAEFLGPQRIVLGRATTGADGTARLQISPFESSQRVGARFAGNADYLAVEETTEVGASVVPLPASPTPAEGDASLAVVSAVMPPLLALTAFVIWVLLIGVVVTTVLAIRRGRPLATASKTERS